MLKPRLKFEYCFLRRFSLYLCISVVGLLFLLACTAERRKSDAELGLNPQQAAGRRIYDAASTMKNVPVATSPILPVANKAQACRAHSRRNI